MIHISLGRETLREIQSDIEEGRSSDGPLSVFIDDDGRIQMRWALPFGSTWSPPLADCAVVLAANE